MEHLAKEQIINIVHAVEKSDRSISNQMKSARS